MVVEHSGQNRIVDTTDRDYPLHRCLHELFEEQVERTPEALAAVCEEEQITYRALNERANRLAHHLLSTGVMPEVPVAVLLERNIDFITAILAIFKAGGAVLPLDPNSPAERLHEILKQSDCRHVLLMDRHTASSEEALRAFRDERPPQAIDITPSLLSGEARENIPSRSRPGNLAYVIYTSGSTGAPKGAMVEQAGMINHIFAKISDLGISQEDRVAQNSPPTFDIVIWQCLAALLVGGQVQIFGDEIAHDPLQLLQQTDQQGITVLQVVPSVLRAMLQQAERMGEERPRLNRLRWIVPTGDALSPELCRQWFKLYPSIPMLNNCGSTECSDDNCHYAIYEPPPADYALSMMPIGRPIPNVRAYILDEQFKPVPPGETGDLYIGGIAVGRGYLNDPARTAEFFLPDPFSQEPGARLYKTRDRARSLPDGVIQFLGRSDSLIKIRGQRVEPGEIEAVLERHPDVREVIVLGRESARGDKYLAAYIVPQRPAALTNEALRAYLKDRLPTYMIPSAFVLLDAMPLNLHGKVDRGSLSDPEQFRQEAAETYIAPVTPTQERLVQVWEELLNVRPIGIRDNFFELGGHSLLAAQLVYRIEEICGRRISATTLLAQPTIEYLANIVDEATPGGQDGVPDEPERLKAKRSFFPLKERLRRGHQK